MKSRHFSAAVTLPALLCLLLMLGSCKSKRNLAYFRDLDQVEGTMPAGDFQVRIVPADQIAIAVTAPDQDAAALYNNPYQPIVTSDYSTGGLLESSGLQRRNQNLRYQPYTVSPDGFINFPLLGKLHVAGMTPLQLAEFLEEKISEKVVEPMVTVELINFHVNVIGEVSRPGSFIVNRERYSILDALADAGDMTPYGDRSNVLLIREEDGQRTYHRINLNSSESLTSPYFYMQQNDVVYVEPNKVREANARTDQERQFRLSMTSVIVSAVSVIASLAIALFIR